VAIPTTVPAPTCPHRPPRHGATLQALAAQKALLRPLASAGRIAWFGYLSSTGAGLLSPWGSGGSCPGRVSVPVRPCARLQLGCHLCTAVSLHEVLELGRWLWSVGPSVGRFCKQQQSVRVYVGNGRVPAYQPRYACMAVCLWHSIDTCLCVCLCARVGTSQACTATGRASGWTRGKRPRCTAGVTMPYCRPEGRRMADHARMAGMSGIWPTPA
jgi:hypothetical protein